MHGLSPKKLNNNKLMSSKTGASYFNNYRKTTIILNKTMFLLP